MSKVEDKFSHSFCSQLGVWKLKQNSGKITIRSKVSVRYQSNKKKLFVSFFCICVLCGAARISAQNLAVKIKISGAARARIELNFSDENSAKGNREISFLYGYANISDLDKRIENLEGFDKEGRKINVENQGAGEYLSARIPSKIVYDVKIDAPNNPASKAHVSWLAENRGLLMLNDLLPQWKEKKSGKITFEIPGDWKLTSSETKIAENIFTSEDVEKAIFLVGKDWREKSLRVEKTNLSFAISGGWQFSDDEAVQMADSILKEYRKTFGEIPSDQTQIFLLPFSPPANANRWQAETRGRTVTIISGALPSKREALQRLHEQLRHEIFHLWIPNSVNLGGNYDWFYEGFTIYQALRTGVRLNQIRFEDYLNTLGQAFDLAKNQNVSLLEMSNRRWTGTANNSVYAKGMIVAFLCDLAMLDQGKRKNPVTEIFQKLYRKHHNSKTKTDGNAAVIEILKTYPELQPLIRKYIEGTEKVELQNPIQPFGLEITGSGGLTQLKVSAELGNRQKDLLDKLGYNQWRKLLRNQL